MDTTHIDYLPKDSGDPDVVLDTVLRITLNEIDVPLRIIENNKITIRGNHTDSENTVSSGFNKTYMSANKAT